MPRCPVPSSMPPLVQSSGHPSGGDGGLEQAIVGSRRRSCARCESLMLKIINCDGHGDDGTALCVYKKTRPCPILNLFFGKIYCRCCA